MSMDPVYLLQPEPDRRVKLSRRAFGSVILGSVGLGFLLKSSLTSDTRQSVAGTGPNRESPGSIALDPSMQTPHLEWVQNFEGQDVEPLIENPAPFLLVVGRHTADEVVQRVTLAVVKRLCKPPAHPNSGFIANSLLQIHQADPRLKLGDDALVAALRRVASK